MDPRDPLIKYQNDAESLEQGALMGAALYLTSKLLGETIGDTAFAVKLRSYLPFMEYIIPPKGWRGWKEEIWNFAGYSVTGAAIGSFGASGVLAQQLEIGFTDAMNHYFLMQITEYFGNQTFRNDVPFIDMVMIKTASQIIRDELIPAGVPAFRGQTKEVLVLNGVTELTAYALIGAVEGASIAAVQKHVRNREVSAEDFIKNMSQHAATRGFEALNTIVFLGPRLHVSDREKEKIQAYAEARGVDIRWALKHGQFRDGRYLASGTSEATGKGAIGYAQGRNIMIRKEFDPANDAFDQMLGAHEAYHVMQEVDSPSWIYLRMHYPEYDGETSHPDHGSRIQEVFAETVLGE